MSHTMKRIAISAIAVFAAATGAAVLADSDEHDNGKVFGARYETQRQDDDARRQPARWKVTSVALDDNGRLSVLEHVVPMKDMPVFGSVTSGMLANGLQLERVDAVFNAYDADMREPHYHFTQRFLAAK